MIVSNWRSLFNILLLVSFFVCRASQGATLTVDGRSISDVYGSNIGSHIVYVSPLPGSKYVTPGSNIIIRSDDYLNANSIQSGMFDVVGTSSGRHDGRVILSDDRKTILFLPTTPYTLGETVSVSMAQQLSTMNGDTISLNPFSFAVSHTNLNADKALVSQLEARFMRGTRSTGQAQSRANYARGIAGKNQLKSEFESLPSNFPPLTVTASDSPSPGYIFLSTIGSTNDSSYGHYLIIADNTGKPVYYKHLGDMLADEAWDFTLQPTGVLTYANPWVDPTWYVMNTSFQIIDSVRCGNGYIDDGHSMTMLPGGNIILLANDYEQIDLSKIVAGGDTNAIVREIVIQELDRNRNVIFQWRTTDHYNITDGFETALTVTDVNPFHCNAVTMDQDGNLLLSTRYLCEITKIDIQTGNIIWRLGGKNNQFKFVNDPTVFSYQHNIRRLTNGDITLWDNGNLRNPPYSRAVEYKLDEINKTATLVWQFRRNPDAYASYMGSNQRLSDGNTLIGWGGAAFPSLTEVRPDGTTALEMAFPYNDVVSYRAYRFPFMFITSPTSKDTVQAGGTATLRWISSGVDTVDIDYSTDGGSSWISGATNYPADADSINLTTSAASGSRLRFRIIESGTWDKGVVFVSDTISVGTFTQVLTPAKQYSFSLSNNYPNPFNPSTTIKYEVASKTLVTLKVYDVLGREIETLVNGSRNPGEYNVTFDGSKLSSGVYFYRLEAGTFVSVRKLVVLK